MAGLNYKIYGTNEIDKSFFFGSYGNKSSDKVKNMNRVIQSLSYKESLALMWTLRPAQEYRDAISCIVTRGDSTSLLDEYSKITPEAIEYLGAMKNKNRAFEVINQNVNDLIENDVDYLSRCFGMNSYNEFVLLSSVSVNCVYDKEIGDKYLNLSFCILDACVKKQRETKEEKGKPFDQKVLEVYNNSECGSVEEIFEMQESISKIIAEKEVAVSGIDEKISEINKITYKYEEIILEKDKNMTFSK